MKRFFAVIGDYIKRSDTLLLVLCLISTIYGIILIASATQFTGRSQYVVIQSLATVIGIFLYVLFSVIDLDIIADKWKILLVFGLVFIALLYKFGVAGDSGNKAWIRFGAIGIQPAEVVKIPFTIILAKLIVDVRERRGLNHVLSVIPITAVFLLHFGLIIVISSDIGSALVYFFIFCVVLFMAGLGLHWFLLGIGTIAAVFPYVWENMLTQRYRDRILAPYDPSVDPTGLGITWQTNQSKAAIASGELFGQGLFNGEYTQSGAIPQQRTDFIFSVCGEELGMVGCAVIVILLMLIICRCLYIGLKVNNHLGMYVCFGFAAMLIFQMFENIGMCLGLTPVIGLTLPFFSYGGSSIITLYAAMGVVSGVKMRPRPERFIRRY